MFNVGDKVKVVSYPADDCPRLGMTGVVISNANGMPCFTRVKFEDGCSELFQHEDGEIELIQDEPECCQCSVDDESYYLSYTRSYGSSGEEEVVHQVKGDAAGDLSEVLSTIQRFLRAAGFNYVAEVNVVTDDGTWFSSNDEVK